MTLRLFSPWSPSVMRSLPWAPRAGGVDAVGHNPLNPDDAAFYRDGEWLQDDPAAVGSLQRGGANNILVPARDVVTGAPHYQVFGERGRTDLAAMAGDGRGAGGKVTVIRIHAYEAETDIVSGSAAAQAVQGVDLNLLAVGDPLVVGNVFTAVAGGQIMRGLLEPVPGEVTAMAAAAEGALARVVSVNQNTGFVRFLFR